MRITILGTRGNIEPSADGYARHSGILVDREMLLDLGELAYLDYGPEHVFITHLHADHAAFLNADVRTNATVYVPEPTKRFPGARVVSRPVRVNAYRITPIPTLHSHRTRSVGYVVEGKGRAFFYSSDLVAIEPQHLPRLGRMDLVVTEGSYIRRGGLVRIDRASGARLGHAGIPDLVELFRSFTERIVIAHFGSWFYKDIEGSIRKIESFSDGVRVRAAHDGLTLRL